MKQYNLRIPEGVKDFIGGQKAYKERVEQTLKALFCQHAYELIETPTFEYMDVLTAGEQVMQDPNLYKWVNRQGEIVALRSDMTRGIARVVATQNSNKPFPQRYAYVATVFRYPARYQGRQHEFTQAGVELIGQEGYASDAEVIMLAIEALRVIGIQDFTIHIGSAAFFEGIIEALEATEAERQSLYGCIAAKDAVALQALLQRLALKDTLASTLSQLMQRSGGIELVREVRAKLRMPKAQEALDYLEKLYSALEAFGVAEGVVFDFSVLSHASYYTGVMFQGYTKGIGTAIVEGGRYDTLLGQFGKALPAVGMALHVDALLQKLQGESPFEKQQTTLIAWDEAAAQVAIGIARTYRAQGLTVAYGNAQTKEEAIAYAQATDMGGVMYFQADETVHIYAVAEGVEKTVTLSDL